MATVPDLQFLDPLQALEERIVRVVQLLAEARQARASAETEAARLREELAARDTELAALRAQVAAGEKERDEVRSRVERLLRQIDSLNLE